MIVPVFLPHLGCRQKCIYCNQFYITGKNAWKDAGLGAHQGSEDHVANEVSAALDPITGGTEVAIYGGNPFGLGTDGLASLFSYFARYREKISSIRLSTEPIVPDIGMIGVLKENNVTTVELGIPVFSDEKLRALGRHHTVRDLSDTCDALARAGFAVGLQVMVGLPGESMQDIHLTVERLLCLKPAFIRIYPLLVLRHTVLHAAYVDNAFSPLDLQEAVVRALFIYLHTEAHGIRVVKMGLTENEFLRSEIVAGPYHPAFGYLVKSEGFYLALLNRCKKYGLSGELTVWLNRSDVPHLMGFRRSNLKRFEKQGLHLSWKECDLETGRFGVGVRERSSYGSVWDAIPMIPS